jgi:Fuc2NAc and GlcNAc transferase
MTTFYYLFLVAGAFLAGWVTSFAVRRAALRLGLVQVPNARSSHSIPTPQGGGIAIAAVSLAGALIASTTDSSFLAIAALTVVVAAFGLADDILDLPAPLRFPIQGLVLAALLAWAGPLPDISLPLGLTIGGWGLSVLVWFCALWWLNLFNFMDGIDGIAASQTVIILMGGLIIAVSLNHEMLTTPVALLALITAAATAGFLVMNWAPARIFMGDAGSNTLAVLILAFALNTVQDGLVGYPSWLILVSPFTSDATVALLRRTARGELPWRAHRRHAYQQLARQWSHARVTLLYAGFTALVALPLAAVAQYNPAASWWLVGLLYALLIAFMVWAGSGAAAERGRE